MGLNTYDPGLYAGNIVEFPVPNDWTTAIATVEVISPNAGGETGLIPYIQDVDVVNPNLIRITYALRQPLTAFVDTNPTWSLLFTVIGDPNIITD